MSLPLEGTLALRRRSPWEAADAGLLLWRANCAYFLPFFAIPFWICAFGLRLLPENLHPWTWLILWYLKPLFDRPILHVISIRFFEPGSGTGRLLRGLGKSILRGLPGDLLWRRFSPLRSAVMPLRILEKLRGKTLRNRKQDLKRSGLSFCSLLTIWGFALELALLAGEILFVAGMIMIIQEDYISLNSSSEGFPGNMGIFLFAAWCFNYMLVGSIYVCMGFGLYINSRVELEGWDIEILLRKFTEARKKKTILPGAPALLLLVWLFLPAALHAEDPADPDGPPLEALEKIFESGDFGGETTRRAIRWKNQAEDQKPAESPRIVSAPWMENIRQALAFSLRLVLALGIGVLVLLCIRYLYKNYRRKPPPSDDRIMEGRYNPAGESPASLLEKARFLYDRGDIRRAWGYGIAALIESWSRYRNLAFPPDATEYGCLALVRAAGAADSAETEVFAVAITRWAAFAYGGRPPPAGSFEEALAFCGSLIPGPENPGLSGSPGNPPEGRHV
ncbi:MAG: hypothetical protein LBK27_01195 [Treponema sp.]|jgi:hypothetical protein|nr:hypothetical protein [Treponema sp.]